MKPNFDTITGKGANPTSGKQNSGSAQHKRVNENVAGKAETTSGMPKSHAR